MSELFDKVALRATVQQHLSAAEKSLESPALDNASLREEIKTLFTDELILFLESNPYYHIESNGSSLLILKKERLLSVQEIKAMIFFGKQLCLLVQQHQTVD